MSFPQLFQDGSRNDWKDAHYDCDVRIEQNSVKVENKLKDAPVLEALVKAGKAEWVLEIRSPRTLFSKIITSNDPVITSSWVESEVSGEISFFSGLVTTKEVELPQNELTSVWQDSNRLVKVPAGWQLVRAFTYSTESDASSLLSFRIDPNLPDGRMSIDQDSSSGSLQFIVYVAEDIRRLIYERYFQIAALIGALGKLKGRSFDEPDEDCRSLKTIFEQNGFTPWDHEDFDPADIATSWEGFRPDLDNDSEED